MKVNSEKTLKKKTDSKNRELYNLTFNKESDGCWYIDLPNWPFSHHNLMMVEGADDLCEFLSDDGRRVTVGVAYSDRPFDVAGCFELEIWLCPVTLFVFKCYPKYIYIKKR